MDIDIVITDENNDVLERVNVYQDGSDSHGALIIKEYIRTTFNMTDIKQNEENP